MDELSKEYLISFFDRSLNFHGDRPEAVRWTETGQLNHYNSLLDIGPIKDNDRILDFGCGKGDLFQFLCDKGHSVQYTGYDINPGLITVAEKKFPSANFRVFDIDRDEVEGEFDYIFICGVFNLELAGLDEVMRRTLVKLFRHCRCALALNCLSSLNPRKVFDMHYTSPGDIFTFAVKNISPFVSLRHDRMLHDFTLFIYRDINQNF